MTEVDLSGLRAHFTGDEVGKLPKINCRECSKGSCGQHQKSRCGECGNWITPAHVHIDYVGHADVTARLLDVDPEWSWKPQATDPDPELLKAALATGNAEIVRAVYDNAPPKFERNNSGFPVALWINLTVGGVTRPGVGTVPATQMDAEKVLIGDALRNAAMRFGVALDLWAKGDRADPTAENSTGSSDAAPRARAPQQPRGQVSRPQAQHPAASADIGDWGVRIDGLVTDEDFDQAKAELDEAHAAGRLSGRLATAVFAAMKAKRATLAARQEQPA